MKCITYRFILNRERYYVVNEMISEEPKNALKITEVFII
jgi:hypothetical protein